MSTCQGKLSDGKQCPKILETGNIFCCWHDPDDESWREIYQRLEKATPEEKANIVLGLIEEHPEHWLLLPERDGVKAALSQIDLGRGTFDKRKAQSGAERPLWWSIDTGGADLSFANLQGADLSSANLHGADLRGANLQGTDLEYAILSGANLRDAKLQDLNLRFANLEGANLMGANLQGADLAGAILWRANLQGAKLQGVDLSFVESLSSIYISYAWLDRTRIQRDLLGDAIGEEYDRDYALAKRGYLALKQNFDDLGDYDAASWAYRKERRMEKLEAREMGRAGLEKRDRRLIRLIGAKPSEERNLEEALAGYFKYVSDTLVEWLCDYGESAWRVIGWMAALLIFIGPLLFSAIGGFVWREDLLDSYFALPSLWLKFWYIYRLYLIYSLDALTTTSFSGLSPNNDAVKLASGLFSITGIFLAGLLGFVAGNRIRRS